MSVPPQSAELGAADHITTTREAVDTHVAQQLAAQKDQFATEFSKYLEGIRADHAAERSRWEKERAAEAEARASRDAMLQQQMASQAQLILDLQYALVLVCSRSLLLI